MSSTNLTSVFTLADKALFLLSLLLIGFSYFYFWQSTPAAYAIVKSPEHDALQISLQEQQIHQVQGALGFSVIEVKAGQIRFTASPCQNKLCIQSGWHTHNGAVAACLPNRVSIQLASRTNDTGYDAINF